MQFVRNLKSDFVLDRMFEMKMKNKTDVFFPFFSSSCFFFTAQIVLLTMQ